jgi:bifunctional DNA-binding transcriptional regulator/antitoxin component of YhaV-PrlF toxin-antitoxin module
MSLVKMRERGQLTIPYEYRKELGLEKKEMINVIKAGEALILTRKQPIGDAISIKMEDAMKKRGLTLQDLLSNLKDQRRRYNKEAYGKTKP